MKKKLLLFSEKMLSFSNLLHSFLFLLLTFFASGVFSQAFYNVNTSTGSNSFPLSSTTSNKVQWIYGPNLFNSAGTTGTAASAGLITKVYFRVNNAATVTYTDYTISLAQNQGTSTTWGSTTFATGLTQCFYQSSFTMTTSAASWYGVTLQTPFTYDPAKSLVFELKVSAGSGISVLQSGTTVQRIYGGYSASTGTSGALLVDFGFDLKTAQNDVGITALVSPSGVCGNTSDPVIARLSNFGTNALSSGLNIPVTAVLSGVSSGSFTKTFNRALAIGASDTIHLGNINSSSFSGNLGIRSWAKYSADTVPKNDSNYTVLPYTGSLSSQPTSLNLSTVSNNQINGSFTASSNTPVSYLVVRYPNGVTPADPVDGVTYTANSSLGAGTVIQLSNGLTFTSPNLSPNTSYDFYIYVSKICNTGPLYLITNPLKGTLKTKLLESTADNYVFGNSTGAVLDSMNGATTLLTTSNDDTPTASATNIGFNFSFEDRSYSTFWVSPDGWLKLGGTSSTSAFSNLLTSTTIANSPLLCPFWDDLATGTTGSVKYLVTGSSPNRILKVQWYVPIPRNTTGPANSTFQIWLYETSNKIEYRYGDIGSSTSSASIGIRGLALTPAKYLTLTLSPLSASSTAASDANTVTPLNGHLYSFVPAADCNPAPTTQPSNISVAPVKGFSSMIGGSFTAASGSPSAYLVVSYPKGSTVTSPTNGVYYYRGNSLGLGRVQSLGHTTSFIAQDLLDTTDYDIYVYSAELCATGPLYNSTSPLKGTTSTYALVKYYSTTDGGLWSSPQTWQGGKVPPTTETVVIVDGSIVTVDMAVITKKLIIGQGTSGVLQWNATSNAMNVTNDITVLSGAKFLPYTTGSSGQTINIGGNFTNDGYVNAAVTSCLLNFNGSQVVGGSMNQVLSGSGTFQGNGTYGIIRTLAFQTTGSSSINTSQNIITTSFVHTAGSLNTNGLLTIDNTAQVYGQQLNLQVASVAVTNMGVAYTNSPVVFGAASTLWTASGTGTANTRYFDGNNVYLATTSGTFGTSNPTHTTGVAANGSVDLLWIGNIGTLGNPFQVTAVTLGTQYFYGNNLYVCTTAGTPSATVPPTHTSGSATSGGATFRYIGSPAKVTVNYNSTTQTVRSLTLTNQGSGYSSVPTLTFNTNGGSVTTSATASVVFFQQIIGPANSATQKSGSATISGGLTINSTQGAASQSGVGAISTTSGGVNYTAVPSVGFTGPSGINLVTNGGSGYTAIPTINLTGGTLISGTALTTSSFTIVVNQGKVISVYLTTPGTACYSTPPTLSFSSGAATLGFPSGCWPSATANIGSNGQITNFTVTNSGYGYVVAPTAGFGITGTYSTVATAPTCRIALYNLTYNNFTPSPVAKINNEGAEVPSNRKINVLTLGSPGLGANFNSNLELFGTAPLTLSSGVLDMAGSNLLFSWNGYAGTTGSLTTNINNAIITLTTRGGGTTGSTLNFPFDATLTCFTGTGTSSANGATIQTITARKVSKPTGGAIGKRAYRVQINSGDVYGTNPTVTLNWNANDSLVSDQAGLFVSQATSLSGSWTARSITSGIANTALALTGSRATATTTPGPISPSNDDYYAWTTTYTPPSPLSYDIKRTTGNSYSSILSSGSTLGWASTSTDDQISPAVSIPSSTFTYQGQNVTGFNMSTNGFIKLITSSSASSSTTGGPNLFGGGTIPLVVAPFWEDLTTSPNLSTIAKLDSCNRYMIIGSSPGTRKIVCEWANYKTFTGTGSLLNFQVVLDESDNSISFNYGSMQSFNGTSDVIHSYSCGLGGLLINGYPLPGQVLAQQFENSTAFSNINSELASFGANGLKIVPDAFSSIKFTPGTYAGYNPPAASAPSNDDASGAIDLKTVTAFPTNLSERFYTSRFATPSSNTVCGGNADDDVWFKFKASQTKSTVRVYGSGGYLPRIQVLTSSFNPLSNSQCALASVKGGTLDVSLSGLTSGQEYYIRAYHNGGGDKATGTVNISSGGAIISVSVTNQGSGYTSSTSGSILTSRVRLSGGGGTDGIATAVITGDKITGVTINNGGYGYTSTPSIDFESPAWALTGEFALVVYSKAENDDCAGATTLTGLTTAGCNNGANSLTDNTVSATPSVQSTICGNPDDDVWYKFTAVNANTKVKVSGSGSFDAAFQVYDGGVTPGNCGSLSSLACINSSGAGATDSTTVSTTIGNTYFVRVYHAGNGTSINETFTICVTSAVPNCISAPIFPTNASSVCAGFVKLNWPTTTGATEYDIYVDKGIGTATTLIASNQSNTSYTASVTEGNYTWRIVPKNIFGSAIGCSDFNFSVNLLPKPGFSLSDTCAGNAVKFVSTSTVSGGTITANSWRFGDGGTGTGNSVNRTYAAPGTTYTVKIISTSNNGCIDSGSRAVSILSNINAGVIGSNQSICYNTTPALITNTSTASGSIGPYSYQWQSSADSITFTDISGATGIDYQPGALTSNRWYRRAAKTTSGCGPSYSNVVRIKCGAILSAGTIGSPQTICFNGTGSALNFTATPTGALGTYTYQWQQSPDSSTWSNISGQTGTTFTPTNVTSVTYYRSLVTSGSCPSAGSNGVKIKLYSPITGGTIGSGQTICAGYTPAGFTQISAPSGGPGTYTFQWQSSTDSINWNNISGATSSSYSSPAVSGLTYFQRLAGNVGCPSGTSNALKIRTLAKPNIVFTASNHCFNDPMPLSNTSNISSGTLTYLWKFGDGGTSTSSVPNKTYASSGTYNVTLVGTSNLGCKDSLTKSVIVATTPSPSFTFVLKCQGDSAIFTDNTVYACGAGSGLVFSWDFGDGTKSNVQNARKRYNSSGTYNVKFKISLPGGFKDSITKTVVFNIKSTPSFTATNNCFPDATTFTNSSTNYASLAWSFGDGTTSTTTSSSFTKTYSVASTYSAKLVATSTFGCKDSIVKTVNVFSKPKAVFSVSNNCIGTSTTFNNSSSGAVSYLWSFGDGNTSSNVNPSNTYASANTFSVKLKVTSSNGCIDSVANTVTIYPNPVANFTTANVCNGFASTFTNSSTGASTYSWNFGNGNSSTATNPTYTYPTAGTYTVTLTSTSSNGCVNTVAKSYTVNSSPKAAFTGGNTCLGNSITFNNTSTGSASNSWNFGDATTSTVASPSKTYTAAGNYTVKLVITNSFGCKDSVTNAITIFAKPVPAFTASNQCLGNAVTFTNQSTGANSQVWVFGDGNSSAANSPSYTYASANTYSVKLVLTSVNNCRDSITKTVTVFPRPSVSFTASPDPICRGGLMSFTNTTTNGATYSWTFGNGNTSTSTSPTNIYNVAGNYTVKLVSVSTNGCRDSLSKTVTVWPRPVASFKVNDGCTGDALSFATNSAGAVGHEWTFGDGNTSTAANPSKGYTAAATYSVRLIVTSVNGCKDTTSSNVTVHPRASVSFTNPTNFCVGLSATFANTSTLSSGTMTYQWNFGDGNSGGAANPTNTYASAGNYTVKLTATTDKGCINTASSSVLVFAKPTANFNANAACAGSTVTFNNTTTGGTTYAWDFGDATTSTLASPTKIYATAGTYTVKLTATNANNCSDVLTKTIVIHANPTANFTATDRCVGQSISFTNTSTGANDVLWQFGDGSSSNDYNPTYTYSNSGSYSVILNVESINGCLSSVTKTVNVFASPKVAFSVNDASQCINGNTFVYTDNSSIASGTLTRLWSFGDGSNSTATNPTKAYSTSANFNVKLVVTSSNGCKDSTSSSVTVNPKPTANFTINKSTQCLNGNLFSFTDASSLSQGSLNLNWTLGDGSEASGTSAVRKYNSAGTYTIRLGVASDLGCIDSISKTVTVYPSPLASFTVNDDIQCLNGNNFSFTNTSSGATGYSSLWNLGDGSTITTPNASRTYTIKGNYKVTLNVSTPFGCKDSAYYTMKVLANPSAITISGPNTAANGSTQIYSVTATPGSTYNWVATNGTVLSNGADRIQIRWNAAGTTGTISVTETGENGCQGNPANYNVTLSPTNSAFNLSRNAFAANLYPNPSTSNFTIEVGTGDMVNMSLYDQLGREVMDGKRFSTSITVSDHNLASGIYTVKLVTDKGRTTILRFEVKN
jgi:PKD repeat protein